MERKRKILVVDDEPDILRLVSKMLELKGYEVVTASGGKEGFAKAVKEKPDVILLDIMMPEMNGHEVLKQLRARAETKRVPVIMLTARKDPDDVVKSLVDGGAVDYIVKPFSSPELLKQICTDIEKVRAYEENVLGESIDSKIDKLIDDSHDK